MTSEEYEELRAKVVASRTAQGLPPTVTDPGTLERVAAIFRLSDEPEEVIIGDKFGSRN